MKAFNKTSYMCFRIYFRPDVYGVNAFIFPTNSIHNIVEKLLYKYILSFFSYILKLTFTGTDFHTISFPTSNSINLECMDKKPILIHKRRDKRQTGHLT